MALMKTGRKLNGEDPKKPKAQQEVKVTAKKQTEPPMKKYTWEDVEKNEAIKAKNRAAKEQYESDVSSYNKAMKLYKEGPGAPSNVGQKLATGKLKGGEAASFEQGDYGTAEKTNKMLREQLKRGELVSIDDPSLDPTTKKLLKGVMFSSMREGSSDVLGTVGKTYVPKGTKYSSYKEIYGEDFNPEEFRAAAKSGKFDEYSKKKGYSGRAFVPNVGFYQEYKEPTAPKGPAYEKEENIDIKKIPIPKMRQLKSDETIENGVIKKKTYGKLAEYKAPAPAEKPDWEAPSRTETKIKTRFKGASNANTFERGPLKSARVVDLNRSGSKEVKVKGYDKEAKMAKAYFSGYEGKSKFDIEGTSEERGVIGKLKADKASLKEGIKAVRRGTAAPSSVDKSERIAGLRAAKKDVKSEIKQAKLASKYVTKLGQEMTGVREGESLSRTGKIKTFTPETMAGFSGSKQDTYIPDANFRNQLNNPANRNTISNQMNAIEPRRSRSQRREERATQRSVMKNLPK